MNLKMTSDRLRIRPIALGDLDLMIELFTDPLVVQYAGGLLSRDEIHDQAPTWIKRGGDGHLGVWCIENKQSGEKLGSVALLPMPIDDDDTDWGTVIEGQMPSGDIEVGYFLKQSAWGQGYATEACRRILKFAFEETPLSEVVATLDDDNDKSWHVLKKSGLTHVGKRRAYAEDDCPDLRITRKQWSASR